jgi:hypothetical protein
MATYISPDHSHEMRQNLLFLREYAKRAIVEEDSSLTVLEDVKEAVVEEMWKTRQSLQLTERDLVVLMFKGVLPQCY